MSEKVLQEFGDKLKEAKDSDPNAYKRFLDEFIGLANDIKSQMGISSAITNVKESFMMPQERFREKLMFELEKSLGPVFYGISDKINQLALDAEGFFMENAVGAGVGGIIGGILGSIIPGVGTTIGAGAGALFGGLAQAIATGQGRSIFDYYNDMKIGRAHV